MSEDKYLWIKQATKEGWIKMKSGGVCDVSYPTSKLRRGRVQRGGDVSPTLTCESGGIVRIEIMENGFFQQALETAEREKAKPGDIVDAFNGRVHKDGISPTITTRPEGKKTAVLPVVEDKRNMIEDVKENEPKQEVDPNLPKYAIRKLTPKECFRLMNFSDEDFEKAKAVNTNSQLYKQAGNSIVRAVLIAIFSQLGIQGHKKWNEMTVEERRALVYKGTILEIK
jgi:DNA (cytosine-5)-methyltransferase 1